MKKILSVLLAAAVATTSVFVAMPVLAGSTSPMDDIAKAFGAAEECLVFSDDFSTSAITNRVSVFSAYTANKQVFNVQNGKWYIGALGGKDLALDGGWTDEALGDFVASFEFSTHQAWGQSHFYYRSSTGWPDQYDYRFSIVNGAGYKATLTLEKRGDSNCRATVEGFDMPLDTEFNVVIASKNHTDSVYIWKKGSVAPTAPTLTINTTGDIRGDLYYYTYQDSISLDNIKVYDLTAVSPENMERATGLSLGDISPFYVNNFGTKYIEPPVMYDAYQPAPFNGTSVVTDNKWVVNGEAGFNGLTGKNDLGDFAVGYQFSVNDTDNNGALNGWLAYNSTTGWGGNGTIETRFSYWQTASGTLNFNLSAIGAQTAAYSMACANNEKLNLLLTKVNGVVNAYIWKVGDAVPTSPVMSVTTTSTAKGDLYFHTTGSQAVFDNFFVYDLKDIGIDTNLYPEHIMQATKLALDNEMLVYSNNFTSAAKPPVDIFSAYNGTSSIANRKWQTTGEVGTSTGLTGKGDLANFVAGFQLTASELNNGFYADFAYHSTTGWSGLNNENRLNLFGQNGKLVFALNGKIGVSKSVVTQYQQNDLINIVLTYIDKQVSAYIWKNGEEIPTTPTLSITATQDTKGDFYFHFAGAKFTMDNFYVYVPVIDTNSLTEQEIEKVTGIEFAATDLIYKSDFAASKMVPVGKFDAYNGTSSIVRNKWVTTGEIGTSTGLTGTTLKNFTLGFQFTVSDFTGNSVYADFAYHSSTGWSNLNNDNRLNMYINGGKLAFVLNAKNGQSKSVKTNYTEGDVLNVIVTYSDKVIKFYIWKFGEELPNVPMLTVVATTATEGDIFFHLAQATFTMDDFYVFKNPVVQDQFEQNNKVLIDKNFDTDGDLLFEAVDTGITKTEKGLFEFNTDGHKMLYSPLLAGGEVAKDFSWQFIYTPVETTWNTDRFKFHCQGDTDSDSVYLQILGSGNATDGKNIQLVRVLNNKAYILSTASVEMHKLNAYTFRIISENNNISVYWWKVGKSTPETPILTAKAEDVVLEKGGFMVEGFHTQFYIDDMKLYNYADGEQRTTYLPELPENALLVDWDFNGMYGKTDFGFDGKGSLKYWQNTLQIQTPMKPERKQITTTNLVGDYSLSDLTWQFDIREFEGWAVDKFIIHSTDGTSFNSIYLLFLGNSAKNLQGGVYGNDPKNSSIRLVQAINGKVTVLGTYNENISRGKGYSVKITCENNNIDVYFGSKRSGKTAKVISAKADSALSQGQILIESFNSKMWLDNVQITNCVGEPSVVYDKSLYAVIK